MAERATRLRPLLAALMLAAAPAAAQTSSCVRDLAGVLRCGLQTGVSPPLAGIHAIRRDNLSDSASARSRVQAEAMRAEQDHQRNNSDAIAATRRQLQCGPRIAPTGSSLPAGAPCF